MIQKILAMYTSKQSSVSLNIESYINIYELLQAPTATHEENRSFGLAHAQWKEKPWIQLGFWIQEHLHHLAIPRLSTTVNSYLYGVTLTLAILAFILGLFSGWGLLSYNGHEPVNVIYFMAMIIFFPLLTMTLTLISMLRANNVQSLLVHISPAFWMEKLLSFLPRHIQVDMHEIKINPLLMNWMMIKRSQIIALCFSFGLLLALLSMVVTKDIAFAWSTTLHISAETFHDFLYTLSFAWRDMFPAAVPSIELIEQSQYFRLGDKLSETMITNASKLGEWWKFLVMATFFYAIVLRFCLFLLASFGFNVALKKSFLSLDGVPKLLREMNEPMITTQSPNDEAVFVPSKDQYGEIVHRLAKRYDMIQGWSLSKEALGVIADSFGIASATFCEVGGTNSFAEDEAIVARSKGNILLVVKGWEPPTDDFADYLIDLTKIADKVIILPTGTAEEHYKIASSSVDVWDRKLSIMNEEKVWLKR